MKENDYFLNLLANPTFNPRDFRDVGLTMENTSLEDKETYKNIEQIRNNQMFQTDGAFDESKFDSAYSMASTSFKVFSDNDLINKISNDPVFDKHDIFVDRSKRIEDKEFKIVKTANPLRERRGLLGTDDVHESEFSVRENAQKELVWDGATNSWQEAPNDNFWENWKHTRVLAQYDEDEFDPITGEKIHYKGEKKLNENGTYYYENLNDRDIYGREVLSKFDTLTVDGSNWNKFDFFDSDDKKKTIAGTLVKNVIKTAPAFIPGINTWYVGARMAMNLTELMAKMGKVFGGSDNPTLSAIEGYIDSLSFSSSDYAQGSPEAEKKPHVWSLENIINMGGDVFLQLAEQRWLFERGPSLFMGKAGYDSKAAKAMKDAELNRIAKENDVLMLANHAKYGGAFEQIKKASDSNVVNSLMEAYTKQYNTIGKHISKAYMTGIVSAEAYGDAKAQGLSDQEAAALTIGYALLEYGLLSTDVGKWVLPELSRDKLQMKQIVRKRLTDLAKNPELKMPDIKASNTEKRNWVKKMVAAGQRLAQATHDPAVSAIKASAAGAMAEGVEETSEELLYDLSKALFNLGSYLRDSDTKITAFDDVLNRYALSFVGGAMGGGLMSLKSDYKQAKQTKNLTADQAYQMTVHYIDQGQEHELLKTARKMILDSPDLAVEVPEIEGIPQYKSGNPSNNKNLAAIDAFTNEVNMIKSLLQANGGLVSDESLMSILTDSDKRFRLAALQSSNFMPSYLQEFNSLQVKIYNKAKEIENAYESLNKIATSDSGKNKNEAYENAKQDTESKVKQLKKELKDLVEEKKEWLSGAKTNEYIERAAFEMMAEVSSVFATTNFVKFAEQKTKEKYGEKATINDATDEDLEKFKEAWVKYKESGYKDDLEIAFRIFKQVNPQASGLISSFVSKYLESKDNIFTKLQGLLSDNTADILASKDVEKQMALVENKIKPSEQMQPYHVKASLLHLLSTKFGIPENDYSSLDSNTQSQYLTEDLASILDAGGLQYLEDQIDKLEFITTAEKEFLTKALIDVQYLTLDRSSKYHHLSDRIAKLNSKINKKKHTPILELLDAWNVSTGSPKKTSALIKELEASLIEATVQGQIKEFTLGADIQEQINGAIANAKLLIGAILAARTDNVSEANIVGYNMLINSINSDSNLATIDKNSANVLLQELNSVINTLLYAKKINAINTGQKLEEENDLDNKFIYLLHSAVSSNLQRLLTNAPDYKLI